jgi:hypothetical protein
MPLLSRLDALAVVLAAVTGLAMAEDRGRTEISPPAAARDTVPPEQLDPEAMTPEVCAELAEYHRRALRAAMIMAGVLPDSDWLSRAPHPAEDCEALRAPGSPADQKPGPPNEGARG